MCSQLVEQGSASNMKLQSTVPAAWLSLLGKWGAKYRMWCNKHQPASRVKTGDLAEDPENKQRTVGGLYAEEPCNHNTKWSCKNASSVGDKYVPGARAKHTSPDCHHLRKAAPKLLVWMKGWQQTWIRGVYDHIHSLWLWELVYFFIENGCKLTLIFILYYLIYKNCKMRQLKLSSVKHFFLLKQYFKTLFVRVGVYW